MVRKDTISEELFNILACPVCKGNLEYTENKDGLRCGKCRHIYPIKGGIPILLPADMQ